MATPMRSLPGGWKFSDGYHYICKVHGRAATRLTTGFVCRDDGVMSFIRTTRNLGEKQRTQWRAEVDVLDMKLRVMSTHPTLAKAKAWVDATLLRGAVRWKP